MEKKAFKDTKFGKFVCDKLPAAVGLIGDVLPSNGLMGVVKNIIQGSQLSDTEKKDLLDKQAEFEATELKFYFEDVQSAREMQKTALQQEDIFSKRFIYYFASGITLLAFAYLFIVSTCQIPESAQRITDISTGAVITSVLGQIISFFFGSSKSSKDKTDLLFKNQN